MPDPEELAMARETNDGKKPLEIAIHRESVDYKAGWVEALREFGARVRDAGAKPKEVPGLVLASKIARGLHDKVVNELLDKVEGEESS